MFMPSFVDEFLKIAAAKEKALRAGAAAAKNIDVALAKYPSLQKLWRPAAIAGGGVGAYSAGSQALEDYQLGRQIRKQQERSRG